MKNFFKAVVFVAISIIPLFTLGQQINRTSWISGDFGVNNTWILNQNMYGNQELPYSPKVGFSGGLGFTYLSYTNGYSTGLRIANLGQSYSGSMAGVNAKRKVNLTYLQLPVMAMHQMSGRFKTTWLEFGPQFMYLLSAHQDFSRNDGRPIVDLQTMSEGHVNVKNRFNPFDVMLKVGLTNMFTSTSKYKLPYRPTEKLIWTLSLDGAIGLTDINQKQFQTENTHHIYGTSHNFYVGIRIGIMQKVKMPYLFSKNNTDSNF